MRTVSISKKTKLTKKSSKLSKKGKKSNNAKKHKKVSQRGGAPFNYTLEEKKLSYRSGKDSFRTMRTIKITDGENPPVVLRYSFSDSIFKKELEDHNSDNESGAQYNFKKEQQITKDDESRCADFASGIIFAYSDPSNKLKEYVTKANEDKPDITEAEKVDNFIDTVIEDLYIFNKDAFDFEATHKYVIKRFITDYFSSN